MPPGLDLQPEIYGRRSSHTMRHCAHTHSLDYPADRQHTCPQQLGEIGRNPPRKHTLATEMDGVTIPAVSAARCDGGKDYTLGTGFEFLPALTKAIS